jgi:hypothetical protein
MAQDSNTGLWLLIGGAVVAYYGYTQGWFASLLGTSTTSTASISPAVSPAAAAALQTVFQTSAGPVSAPTGSPQAQVLGAGGTPAQALIAAGFTQAQIQALINSNAKPGPGSGLTGLGWRRSWVNYRRRYA